jgi:hypothetical protein
LIIGSNTAKEKCVTKLYMVQYSWFWKIIRQKFTENIKEVAGKQSYAV